MASSRTRTDRPAPERPEEGDLFRPVDMLAKLFEGPEGGAFGLEQVLERLEWKETTR